MKSKGSSLKRTLTQRLSAAIGMNAFKKRTGVSQKISVPSYEGFALGCSWPSSVFPVWVADAAFVSAFAVVCPLTEWARAADSVSLGAVLAPWWRRVVPFLTGEEPTFDASNKWF